MFLYNGKKDEVIPFDFAQDSFKEIKKFYEPRNITAIVEKYNKGRDKANQWNLTEIDKNGTRKDYPLLWEPVEITEKVNPDLGHYYDSDMWAELQKFFKKVDL